MPQRSVVYLVGAGPGDPGLITVRGLEVVREADVVVYDHLVSERLLESCRPSARIIYVGKESGRVTHSQARINRLLIRHAQAGRRVVRLKGGDPFIFGRGGEEALALIKRRVPFEIIPGVTSASAVPAYAGIPITHRELASSVAFVTGHEDPAKGERAVRWDRLATAVDTIVCLMGVRRLPEIVAALVRHGRPASTPCAVIQWGTVARQRTVTGTLATIVRRAEQAKLWPPGIIVIGEVVRLREQLAWFEPPTGPRKRSGPQVSRAVGASRRPLLGKRVLVTRPGDRADSMVRQLEALGAEVVLLPAIELEPLPVNGLFNQSIERIDEFDWVFFTSPEGIAMFRRQLARRRRDLRILLGRHIAAIGPKTAAAIEACGIHVDYIPAQYTQEGIVAGLTRRALRGKRGLLLNAEGSREALERGLTRLGMNIVRIPLYRAVTPPGLARNLARTLEQPIDLVTVTSASCVDHVTQALKACGQSRLLPRLRFASIGPATSAAVRAAGGKLACEAKTSTAEGLVDAIVRRSRARYQISSSTSDQRPT